MLKRKKAPAAPLMVFDSDGFFCPSLTGLRVGGYDPSVIQTVGTRIIPLSAGETRVDGASAWGTDRFVMRATA